MDIVTIVPGGPYYNYKKPIWAVGHCADYKLQMTFLLYGNSFIQPKSMLSNSKLQKPQVRSQLAIPQAWPMDQTNHGPLGGLRQSVSLRIASAASNL